MARALYREWFVHFRFPGHEKVRMVESAAGQMPAGWAPTKVPDAVYINPSTPVAKETEKPYVAMNGLSNDSMLITITEYRTGNSGAKFRNADTLFARITLCLENGKTGFVQFLPSPDAVGIGSTEFIVLRSRTLCPEFVYLLARTEEFRGNAIKSMSGASGRQRVQEQCFERFKIVHPDPGTLGRFSELVRPLFRMIFLLSDKNIVLRRTRDLLLPRLVAGELDVSALDIAVPPAAPV
jgi:type I restriction enzyme S subunit